MSQAKEQESMKVMVFIALLLAAGLIFGAGVMVGVNLAREEKAVRHTPPVPPAEEPHQEMVFPEVLEGRKAPEQLRVQPPAPEPKPAAAVEKKPPAAPPPAPPVAAISPERTSPAVGGGFALQVAAYRDSDPAARVAEKLRAAGYAQVEIVKSEVPGKGLYFRVRLGRYPDRETAETDRQKLAREMALDAMIVRVD